VASAEFVSRIDPNLPFQELILVFLFKASARGAQREALVLRRSQWRHASLLQQARGDAE